MRGQIFYSVLYIIVGIIVMVYVPLSLKGRVKTVIKTNKVFSEPLHFEIDEKVIKVSQGEETAELPWNQVYKVTGNKKEYLFSATDVMRISFRKNNLERNFQR